MQSDRAKMLAWISSKKIIPTMLEPKQGYIRYLQAYNKEAIAHLQNRSLLQISFDGSPDQCFPGTPYSRRNWNPKNICKWNSVLGKNGTSVILKYIDDKAFICNNADTCYIFDKGVLPTLVAEGTRFITGTPGGVEIYNAENGILLQTIHWAANDQNFSASDNGKIVITHPGSGFETRVWDVATGECTQIIADNDISYCPKRILSPDGKYLAAAYQSYGDISSGKFKIWETASGKILFAGHIRLLQKTLILGEKELEPRSYWEINSLSFSPDSTYLILTTGCEIEILDARTGKHKVCLNIRLRFSSFFFRCSLCCHVS